MLIVVDLPLSSTRLHFLVVLSLQVLIAADIQLHHAVDIHLRQICFCFADRGWYTALLDTAVSSCVASLCVFDSC